MKTSGQVTFAGPTVKIRYGCSTVRSQYGTVAVQYGRSTVRYGAVTIRFGTVAVRYGHTVNIFTVIEREHAINRYRSVARRAGVPSGVLPLPI